MARLLSNQVTSANGTVTASTSTKTMVTDDSLKTEKSNPKDSPQTVKRRSDPVATNGTTPKAINGNTPRKLSFKLRNASTSSSGRPVFRATKVTLNSNSVHELANKFNAIVIQDDEEGRALLKRLSSGNHVPLKRASTKPSEGSVRAAVQKLETGRTNHSHDRPKLVLVRKHSSSKFNKKSSTLQRRLDDVAETTNDVDDKISVTSLNTQIKSKPKSLLNETHQRNSDTNLKGTNSDKNNSVLNAIEKLNNNNTKNEEKLRFDRIKLSNNEKRVTKIIETINNIERRDVDDDVFIENKQVPDATSLDNRVDVQAPGVDSTDQTNNGEKPTLINYRSKKPLSRVVNSTTSKHEIINHKQVFRKFIISSAGLHEPPNTDNMKTKLADVPKFSTDPAVEIIPDSANHETQKSDPGICKDELPTNDKTSSSDTKLNRQRHSMNTSYLFSSMNKPRLRPKPSIESKKRAFFNSTPSLLTTNGCSDQKPDTTNILQHKKLSLPKNQSVLEGVLDSSSDNVSLPIKETGKNTNVKPNRSFLWSNKERSMTLPVDTEKKLNLNNIKEKEAIIMAGFIQNVEAKLRNNSCLFTENKIKKGEFDDQPVYVNGNMCKEPVIKDAESKISLSAHVRASEVPAESLEEKENLKIDSQTNRSSLGVVNGNELNTKVTVSSNIATGAPSYEEMENNRNTTVRKSFLYRNIYITEARNEQIVPVEAKNDVIIDTNNYEEIQQRITATNVTGYLDSSKLSYGYVDPGNYEELEDAYASIPEDFEENIYDDVLNVRAAVRELELESNISGEHYESVYQVHLEPFDKDSDSSCDQSNSLYGLTGVRPSSRASSSASYHVTGQPTPRSETSDEWMDVDNSGDEEILVYRERDRPRVRNNAAGGWCQKVRREWSKRTNNFSPDDSDSEANSHQYEAVKAAESGMAVAVCDDFDGSFDSDSSFDEVDHEDRTLKSRLPKEPHQDRTLPSVPQNEGIYEFMKQAGRRMRKHWSIGKSLRRIRKMSVGTSVTSVTSEEPASTNGSSLNRRRWSSFKSKFKSQSTINSGSTFYLDNDDSSSNKTESIDSFDKQSTLTSTTNMTVTSQSNPIVTVDPRRFSMSSIRPTSPPPPPPTTVNRSPAVSANSDDTPKKSNRSGNSTESWYSESDGFDTSNGSYSERSFHKTQSSTWYFDTSLWDNSFATNADSSSEHTGSSQGSDLQLRFPDEPLYQFYNATVTEEELNLCYSTIDGNGKEPLDSDGYEEIGDHLISRPSALELIMPNHGHHRTLWCEIPQVRNSEILRSLTKDERKLQEAKFEVMTSEASYFKSLNVLEKHFAASPLFEDESVISVKDRKSLFGYVTPVRKCSEKLLSSLERCWQESIMLANICDIVYKHAVQHFQVYVSYCSNQIGLNVTLKKLRESNRKFEDALTQLEADPKCESLSLHSFLMLPMQRITRMPLLLDAIFTKLDQSHPEYSSCQLALKTLNDFVRRCNEETRQQERVIEMVKLSRQLEFSKDVRTLPIVSKHRWLVRSGQVLQVNPEMRQTFGRKFTKQGIKITLFLLNDYLLLARKRSEDSYLVIDHCQKNLIQMNKEDDIVNNSSRYLLRLAMLKNHDGKLTEMILSCESETSRQRWIQAVMPPTSENPGESIYEEWDCPQVVAVHSYMSVQPDEISLQKGDIVNVTKKMTDGWYYGERTRDGETGWFPGNHVFEINSSHVRARNLQQRYRLLMLSGSYLLQQQSQQQTNKKQLRQ